ncbi:MAG: hypothetical protein JNL74_00265 [Fibrobacteres bacterium]|nr:hypothetical protein [Fibrobacterota bacterium]
MVTHITQTAERSWKYLNALEQEQVALKLATMSDDVQAALKAKQINVDNQIHVLRVSNKVRLLWKFEKEDMISVEDITYKEILDRVVGL